MGSAILQDKVMLFVKLGQDGHSLGACQESQRIHMLCLLKAAAGVMPHINVVRVNISKPPLEFNQLELRRRVPALNITPANSNEGPEPLDSPDDIVSCIETLYPGGLNIPSIDYETEANRVSRNFFSKFCFFVRGVTKDSSHLEAELHELDKFLQDSSSERGEAGFICGAEPSLLDCEILPKLHQVRVAVQAIKGYSIPVRMTALWRYLHAAYSCEAFTNSCPPDHEILLHWFEHCGSPEAIKQCRKILAQAGHEGHSPSFSFSIPATATRIEIE